MQAEQLPRPHTRIQGQVEQGGHGTELGNHGRFGRSNHRLAQRGDDVTNVISIWGGR